MCCTKIFRMYLNMLFADACIIGLYNLCGLQLKCRVQCSVIASVNLCRTQTRKSGTLQVQRLYEDVETTSIPLFSSWYKQIHINNCYKTLHLTNYKYKRL